MKAHGSYLRLCLVPVLFSPRPSRSVHFGDVSETNHVTQQRLTAAKCRGLGTRQPSTLIIVIVKDFSSKY